VGAGRTLRSHLRRLVACSIFLPLSLRGQFKFTSGDEGFCIAGFVILTTLLRPSGGWLADRIGDARVLQGVFPAVIPFALLLSWRSTIPFTMTRSTMAGHAEAILPAAVISAFLFTACAGPFIVVRRIDAKVRASR
jgi:nitrate/nitrite transporter NarK